MPKMYALFKYSYDYYQWEDFVVASPNQERLEKYWEAIRNYDNDILAFDDEEHDSLAAGERTHYMILPIKVIGEDDA